MLNEQQYSTEPGTERHFHYDQWVELVSRMSEIFHIGPEKQQKILHNRVMKLTAAIPFVAGCVNPMRTALSHLSVYMVAASAGGKDIFGHNFSDNDDLFTRLERISHFSGGNELLIRRGMNMLALAMLEDHKTDEEEDKLNRKYNPLSSGIWDYKTLSEKLKDEISAVPADELDAIMNINTDIPGYWDT